MSDAQTETVETTRGDRSEIERLLDDAVNGNRVALARLLSAIERRGPNCKEIAHVTYRTPLSYSVGITGAPGAGKSTLTDRLLSVARRGWGEDDPIDRLAVLAVDPSSPFSGGAILGDRVRMQSHATDPAIFIRSMATRGHLGGLALAVPDALRLLGAVGMPVVLVETVGVGQMEVEIASAADTTVVVVTPGWGDSMQANKAGLLEVADLFVINKADRAGVREARRDLEQMLDLSGSSEWRPPIVETVASAGDGVDELWTQVSLHRSYLANSGLLVSKRADRMDLELRRVISVRISEVVDEIVAGSRYMSLVAAMLSGELDPYEAADRLIDENRTRL
ncbi:MAG: methylmalonyl Co-A mutase-associated GTPase MeaB [Acidimicrobiales bacterium]|jgi:LAO/AO transport system kinase